jgi:hypothetical protein
MLSFDFYSPAMCHDHVFQNYYQNYQKITGSKNTMGPTPTSAEADVWVDKPAQPHKKTSSAAS